jgi:1-acyl-sn-glycerol-3-phosphate acyltransferase
MLSFLRGPVLGVITIGLMVLNVVVIAIPLLSVALLKVLPIPPLRRWLSGVLTKIAELWVDINAVIFRLTQDFEWSIEGTDGLDYGSHYLVMSNHRSWVDVVVLQNVFRRKIPFLKFFIKKELFWVPFLGQAWWALDMPFMQRHSREYLKAHPEAKGQDLEATRIACEKFRDIPTSVMNFVEGTRFTKEKHAAQSSPFDNLLKPRAGGVSFVVSAMDGMLDTLLDVTLAYQPDPLNFWQFCCGRMKKISVRVRHRELPAWAAGDYQADPAFRARFQDWLNDLWTSKDADYAALVIQARA